MMIDSLSRLSAKSKWTISKLYLWGRSTAELKKDDVFLAFYPKTGSTWVRIFLYNLLGQTNVQANFSFDDLDKEMPEFANQSFFNTWKFNNSPRLIKTHSQYRSIFRRNRAIVFLREPRDTMVSFLHYANASKKIEFSGDLHDLVHHKSLGLDKYFRFYNSWLPRAGLVMKYEDLRAEPLREFKRITEFLGIPTDETEITHAIEVSSLARTRKAQERSSSDFNNQFEPGFKFAREGAVGSGAINFDQELEKFLQNRLQHYNFRFYS